MKMSVNKAELYQPDGITGILKPIEPNPNIVPWVVVHMFSYRHRKYRALGTKDGIKWYFLYHCTNDGLIGKPYNWYFDEGKRKLAVGRTANITDRDTLIALRQRASELLEKP